MNESIMDWLETDNFDAYGDSIDGEFSDSLYEGENLESELYGESGSAESQDSKRRARARREAQARRRRKQAQMTARNKMTPRVRALGDGRRPVTEAREIQKTQDEIEKVELESQVQGDLFSRALNMHQRRLGRSEQAFAMSKVLDELKVRLPDLVQDDAIRTAFGLAPLLVLAPERKGKGIESLIADPRVWSTLLIAGIAIFAKNRAASLEVKVLTPTITLSATTPKNTLFAVVVDKNGTPVFPPPQITWISENNAVATVVPNTGEVTLVGPGTTVISATSAGAKTGVATVIVQ